MVDVYIYISPRIQSPSKIMIGQTASEIILSAKSAPEWSSQSGEQLAQDATKESLVSINFPIS